MEHSLIWYEGAPLWVEPGDSHVLELIPCPAVQRKTCLRAFIITFLLVLVDVELKRGITTIPDRWHSRHNEESLATAHDGMTKAYREGD